MMAVGKLTLAEVARVLDAEVLSGTAALETTEVAVGAGADLMSDVLAFINPDALLLTGLANVQSIRTALVADVRALVYVRGKRPDREGVALAEEHGLPLLCTPMTMFEACGRLYGAGLPPCVLPPRRAHDNDTVQTRV
jgi:predicted transcriptional regulator